MPHRSLTVTEMAAAHKLFDHIVAAEYGGAPDEGESMASYTLRIWALCADAVIEPPPKRDGAEERHAATATAGAR